MTKNSTKRKVKCKEVENHFRLTYAPKLEIKSKTPSQNPIYLFNLFSSLIAIIALVVVVVVVAIKLYLKTRACNKQQQEQTVCQTSM